MFRLLGQLEVEGVPRAALGGPKQRSMLAFLLLHANELVRRDRVIDAVWGEAPPPTATAIVHGYVRKLRAALEGTGARIVARSPGYVLELEDDALDVRRFERLAQEGREALTFGDAARARALLGEALGLWRGDAMADLTYEAWVDAEARRLDALRLETAMDRIDADLSLGANGGVAGELESLIARHPLVERLRAQLMLAQYRAGRQADALETYQATRHVLGGELGLEPGPQLRDLERRILQHDPTLGGTRRSPVVKRVVGRRTLVSLGIVAIAGLATTLGLLASGGQPSAQLGAAASDQANRVLMIDPGSGRVEAAADLPGAPTAVAVGLGSAWVAEPSAQSLARVDAASGSVTDSIPVAGQPARVTTSGGAVWVAGTVGGRINRIDPDTASVTQTIELGGANIADIASGDGSVWAASTNDHLLVEIDPVTGSVRRRIVLDIAPTALAVGNGVIWATSFDTNVLEGLDRRSGRVLSTTAVGQGPAAIAVGRDAVWVANGLDATVSRVDPRTGSVRATIPVPSGPEAIAVTPAGVWVASADGALLSRIDPRRNEVASSRRVGGRPEALTLSGDRLWLVSSLRGDRHRGGTLVLARTGTFATTDPAFVLDGLFARPMYDALVRFQAAGGPSGLRLLPDLAIAVPRPTAGGTTYTFRLRPGIRYSDGRVLRASDFRRAIERLFHVGSFGSSYYAGVLGASVCPPQRECDLSQGIQTDDPKGTVVFRLREPDPDFLYKLTVIAFSAPVPPGTPEADVGMKAIPGTGPYRLTAVHRGELRFERNPFFREWSRAAQPSGNPDMIVWHSEPSPAAAVAAVKAGRADWLYGNVPAAELSSLRLHFPSLLHVNPFPIVEFIALNTHRKPFDDVRVRRALNFAIDRAKVVHWYGGPLIARPLCQPLAPWLPGYRPYCPYTRGPGADGRWRAPDLARARRLVAASGTKGERVDVWGAADSAVPTQVPRHVADVLRSLGYRVRLHVVPSSTIRPAMRRDFQLTAEGDWLPDYPAPSAYLPLFFGCGGSLSNGYTCDPELDREMLRASRLQLTDPARSAALWTKINRRLVDEAFWVPTVNIQEAEIVSRRVRNYQFSPVSGFLPDQVWLR
jgi:ABC-type transport system substrate-binding protein/DNA-binding SARP family transcriptional activator/DNA-binding beta-propeller fold protein YncE